MNNEFTKWFIMCVRDKYADFNGRARRKEYWMFVLVVLILSIILSVIELIVGLTIPILSYILSLGLFLPGLGVSIRRLHDVGKSGWWYLIIFVPLLGAIYLIYLMVQDGQPETNQWGPNPKSGQA